MRHRNTYFMIMITLVLGVLACNLSAELDSSGAVLPTITEDTSTSPTSAVVDAIEPAGETDSSESPPVSMAPGDCIQPSDLVYVGAFRFPDASGGSSWEYSGHGLTYYPEGNPGGPDDGFPGSLFGVGHDQQMLVSEISIPEPVISTNLDDLNTASTLQPFADITGGIFVADEMVIPRAGIEYLPPQGDQTTGKLHFVFGQHIQDFEPSHGWSELDLSNPQAAGPWVFNGFANYVTSDYLFEIPQEWADANTPNQLLATGRAREGLWSGRGPALFAYSPWSDGNSLAPNAALTSITPLLLYGVQEPGIPDIVSDESMAMDGYLDADHWWGGAWLTTSPQGAASEKAAVIFVGTKALGDEWYGFANGVVWEYDCAEQAPPTCPDVPEWPYDDRGFWAEDYQAQIIFYDPAELVAVARGEMETWEPQPYATLSIDEVLFDPQLNFAEYKRDIVGAAAFDHARGLLYVIERLGDEYKSILHVWRLEE